MENIDYKLLLRFIFNNILIVLFIISALNLFPDYSIYNRPILENIITFLGVIIIFTWYDYLVILKKY